MNMLILHPNTELLLRSMQTQLPQSLLLSGQSGSGLLTVAHQLAKSKHSLILLPKNTKGEREDITGTIGIEAIRSLYEHTRTKSRSKRVIIIDNAERMSRGAQSAFLKLLEEPNSTSHFILTSHSPDTLLPTIRSRVQHLRLQPITSEQSKQLIEHLGVHDAIKQTQLLFLAQGRPAELTRLASDSSYFDQRAVIINDARTFMAADTYQKMRLIQKYRTNRDEALQLIDSTIAILRFTLTSKPHHNLIIQLDRLLTAREHIAVNQSIPLQLADAVL